MPPPALQQLYTQSGRSLTLSLSHLMPHCPAPPTTPHPPLPTMPRLSGFFSHPKFESLSCGAVWFLHMPSLFEFMKIICRIFIAFVFVVCQQQRSQFCFLLLLLLFFSFSKCLFFLFFVLLLFLFGLMFSFFRS